MDIFKYPTTMKAKFPLLLFAFMLCLKLGAQTSKKAEDLVNNFISALKEKKWDMIKSCCIATMDDCKLIGMPVDASISNDSLVAKTERKLKPVFDELLKFSSSVGLDWNTIETDSISEAISPNKTQVNVWLSQSTPERNLKLEFRQIYDFNGTYKLTTWSKFKVDDANACKIIAQKMLNALQKEDVKMFLNDVMPSQNDFDKLYKVIYAESPEILKMNTAEALNIIAKKLEEGFNNILAEGRKEGILWANTKLSFSGHSSSAHENYTEFSVPFQFLANSKEYRIEINFCNWLNENPYIFVLGEIKWIGEVQK